MKIYRGYSDQGDAANTVSVLVYEEGHETYRLRHMIVHSPSGMSWGFHGSGPADLALSVLADYLDEATAIPTHERYDHDIADGIQETGAWLLHQEFKRDVVANLPQDGNVTIDGADIEAWLAPRRGRATSPRAAPPGSPGHARGTHRRLRGRRARHRG